MGGFGGSFGDAFGSRFGGGCGSGLFGGLQSNRLHRRTLVSSVADGSGTQEVEVAGCGVDTGRAGDQAVSGKLETLGIAQTASGATAAATVAACVAGGRTDQAAGFGVEQ